MELGFHIPIFDIDGGTPAIAGELARVGQAAEAAGATWLSFMDHYFQIEPTGLPAEANMLEGYTTLGYLAAHTSSIDLGLLVTGVTYRHPGLLAKIVTTLDVLSGGRATLGIGAAWFEREHRGLGVEFPPLAERFERLEETLRICAQMWDPDNNGPFEGKYYQLAETLCSPQPIHRPNVLIGGGGEKKTLRLVAQYGDACNLFGTSPEDVAHKLDVLRRHCDDVGRDFDTIRTTIMANNPRPNPDVRDEFVRSMADYAKLGIDAVLITPTTSSPAAWIEGMAPAVPQLADLG
ncbi:LLM class F420-dependent oxidoreductase [Nocardia sp. 852002-20019_SCH5090214]|jgi:F420-dependent oxidoreductase-like protein|uniref:TIGR03560 family F420-dependent LLM class oxidoreductase n=1 Tax=Nocardia nova TaxID=37330 RepID=A0A2S5ZVS0_9NOCA|nr:MULTISPECIES: LLM class F420-dependent oxidoreductase [Nocardia]MBF6146800.1 LLM class F420-dependent oxidoreductase [Nocardia nova]MBV7704404.1 LLM class F420-dependent oxidoreductase [Nocardia nova]OBA66071.1 LLM class F420-dependent oxidoreductase [Nocardia sp. 852002-20019_SCH5090214]PPI98456.1 TIGR03560 family F420-dependent LLM class oxidoreductase [Nocardia nova]PPJ03974.1 TIGR03560 family F420-dependent LLM class oxidoreductase [Nocardia nova]